MGQSLKMFILKVQLPTHAAGEQIQRFLDMKETGKIVLNVKDGAVLAVEITHRAE